jgi:hypothetical protein
MITGTRSFLLAGILWGAACAPATTSGPTPAPCATPMMREVLYFGRAIDDTGLVSDSAWERFVAEVITPAFPEGFSVMSGVGQWRGADGKVISEPNKMVILARPGSPETEVTILRVAERYRAQFHQEAVMHEHSTTCITMIGGIP